MKRKLAPAEVTAPLRLDLGCGKNKKPGFVGIDALKFDGVDEVLNLCSVWADKVSWKTPDGKFIERTDLAGQFKPWPWKNDSVDEVYSSHFIEHLSGPQRIHFFNELYRVLRKDAKATIIVPHWRSGRAYGDLTHQWPPVVEFFWYYLDKNWRAANAPHVPLLCDFACTWGYSLAHPWPLKNQEAQAFALNHYAEVAQDMIVTAAARK